MNTSIITHSLRKNVSIAHVKSCQIDSYVNTILYPQLINAGLHAQDLFLHDVSHATTHLNC